MRRAASRKRQRLRLVLIGLVLTGSAVALMLVAFEDGIVLFRGPSEVKTMAFDPEKKFRLGGLVVEGSVSMAEDGVTTLFGVTDGVEEVTVRYTGLLPDLFREGQGIVTQGTVREDGVFIAAEVLAKHDENYMPAEAVEAMKRAGTWKGDETDTETLEGAGS